MNRFAIMAGMAMLSGMAAPGLTAQDMEEVEEAPAESTEEKKAEVTGVAWTEDYEAGLKDAKESGKLVILEFTATW
ncbi:MAG: thioredoxin family protein [Planctomycetes bacterium]|nr:thioredoxin family protein [Planctomycetota bacterium]